MADDMDTGDLGISSETEIDKLEKIVPYLLLAQAAQQIGSSISQATGGPAIQGTSPWGALQMQIGLARNKQNIADKRRLVETGNLTPEQKALLEFGGDVGLKEYAKSQFADPTTYNTASGLWVQQGRTFSKIPGSEPPDSYVKFGTNTLLNRRTMEVIKGPDEEGSDWSFKEWTGPSGERVVGWVNSKTREKQADYAAPPMQEVVERDPTTGQTYVTRKRMPTSSTGGGGIGAPPAPVDALLTRHERAAGVPTGSYKALVGAESSFDPQAFNPDNFDSGLAQMIPSTARSVAKQYGYGEVFENQSDEQVSQTLRSNPSLASFLGSKYWADMLKKFKGNETHALVAWNRGPDKAEEWIANGADESALPAATQGLLQRYNQQRSQLVRLPGRPINQENEKKLTTVEGVPVLVDTKTNTAEPVKVIGDTPKSTAAVSALDEIKYLNTMIDKNPSLAGPAGVAQSWMELPLGWLHPGAGEPARNYRRSFERLRTTLLPQVLQERGRSISDRDRALMAELIEGGKTLSTYTGTKATLDWLKTVVSSGVPQERIDNARKNVESNIKPRPGRNFGSVTTLPADLEAGDIVNGYRFKGGDNKPENWEKIK